MGRGNKVVWCLPATTGYLPPACLTSVLEMLASAAALQAIHSYFFLAAHVMGRGVLVHALCLYFSTWAIAFATSITPFLHSY